MNKKKKKKSGSLGLVQQLNRSLSKPIPHVSNYKDYPQSNLYYAFGLKPSKKQDFDRDRILNWEDCRPYNKKKQAYATGKQAGSFGQTASNVGQSISNIFRRKSDSATYDFNIGTAYSTSGGSGGSGISGGGGGKSSSSKPKETYIEKRNREAQAEAQRDLERQKKAIEEATKKQQEIQKARQEQTRKQQEKAQAGTVSGQLESVSSSKGTMNNYTINQVSTKGSYQTKSGMYVSTVMGVPEVSRSTLSMLPPTPFERESFAQKSIESEAITRVPAQYFGTIFSKKLSPELQERASEGGIGKQFITFLNPSFQYDVAKYNIKLKKDIKEQGKINKKVEEKYQDLLKSGISKEELESGEIKSILTPSQESTLRRYNVYAGYSQKNFEEKGLEGGKTIYERIAKSGLTERQKGITAGVVSVTETVPYLFAPTRAVLGLDITMEGISTIQSAETKREKIIGAGQIGLGGLLAYSGVKGTMGASSGLSVGGSPTKLKVIKGITYVGGVTTAGGVGALTYYSRLKETESKSVALGSAIGTGGTILTGIYAPLLKDVSIFGKKPTQVIPSREVQEAVKPFSRQRTTLLLKDKSGRYLFGKTKSGQIISIGGGIEKGQTPRTALESELFQETGLSIKDISGLKFRKAYITPEETFYTFTGNLKGGAKPIPSSDIKSFVYLDPSKIPKITGQTAKYPISVPVKTGFLSGGRLRSYEAGILTRIESGSNKPINWLVAETKGGGYILGTQSRYNIPYSSQKQYLAEEELLLAHGTTKPAILRRFGFKEKDFPVRGEFTKRGQAEGLYVQPPISSSNYPSVVKLERYSGTGRKIGSSEIKNLPFGIKKESSEGYIGLSYLGFGESTSETLSIGKTGKRTAFIFTESPKLLEKTPKTISGMESELIIPVGEKVGTSGRAQIFSIGRKKVYIQPTKILSGKSSGGSGAQRQFQNLIKSSYAPSTSYVPGIAPSLYGLGSSGILSRSSSVKYRESFIRRETKKESYKEPSKTSKPYELLGNYKYVEPYSYTYPKEKVDYYYPYKEQGKRILPIIPILPRIPFNEKQKPSRQQKPMKTQYQPSFTALGLGIRRKVPKDYEKYGYGGIQLRAIPINEKSVTQSMDDVIKKIDNSLSNRFAHKKKKRKFNII